MNVTNATRIFSFGAFLVLFVFPFDAHAALTDSLTDYYKFDSSNSNDSVGANNGSDTSVTYSVGNGKINVGGGVSTLGYIDFGTSVGGTAAMTYNMWIKPGTQDNTNDIYHGLMGSGGASNNIMFLKGDANKLAAYVTGTTGTASVDPVSTAIDVSGNVWTMVTMTYDSSSGLIVYINGTSAGTDVAKGTALVPSHGFHVGLDPAGTVRLYNGAFDEVGVWTRALTSSEVASLYNSGVGLQYPFGISSGTTNRLAKFVTTSTIGDSLFSDDGSNMTLTSGNLFMQIGSLIDTITNGALNFGTINATSITIGRSAITTTIPGTISFGKAVTVTNCNSTASPATCGSAPSGSVAMAAGGTTLLVNTAAVTGDSQILITEDSSLGTRLGITCNATTGRVYSIGARVVGSSFTIKSSAKPVTNRACLSYWIIN